MVGVGVTDLVSVIEADACDEQVLLQGDATFIPGDLVDYLELAALHQVADAAGNLTPYSSVLITGAQPPSIVSASTLDGNDDGHIDHLKVTFSRPMADSTFPGYAENGEGWPLLAV